MKKETKKFVVSGFIGLLTFIFFGFSFIFVKMKWGNEWWSGLQTSGYKLIGEVDGFFGFLSDSFSVLILIFAGIVCLLSLFGFLNSIDKTKIKFGKLSVEKLLKWILFIWLCLAFLNCFWVLIDCGILTSKYGDKSFKYATTFSPWFILIIYSVNYAYYCIIDGKFLWLPNIWEKFGKKIRKTNTEDLNIIDTQKTDEVIEEASSIETEENEEEKENLNKKKIKKEKKLKK